MTIQEIKNMLSSQNPNGQFNSLQMVQQKDSDGVLADWYSHWCNTTRTRLTMHGDTFRALQANRALSTLVLKDREVVPASGDRAAYSRYIVVIPTNIADVF